MARLWVSMAADGEASEVERAALDEHLEHCDDCSEWRALAEAVVLHVRTTPPSPVPEGLLPVLPAPRRVRRRRQFAVRIGSVVAARALAVRRRPACGDRRRLEYERQRGRAAVPDRDGPAVAPNALTL
jgi:predicted anti-sigma-YlaC factor YlaD